MLYVEMRRVRRALTWFTAILAANVVLIVIAYYSSTKHGSHAGTITFSQLLTGALFGPLVIASFLACDLSAEGSTLPILWTRPIARTQIAWRFFGVDFAGIVASYAIVIAFAFLAMAAIQARTTITYDVESFSVAALVLAASLMLYALVQLVAARFGRAPAIVGCLWAAMVVLGILYELHLPPLLHWIAYALNYLSPLAWLGDLQSHAGAPSSDSHVIHLAVAWRAVGAFCIALVALAAAVPLWSTREA